LRTAMTAILGSAVYAQGRTIVFVVFDESQGGGTIPFIAVAPQLAAGTVATAQLDHYALLRYTEDALGISDHLGKAATAADLRAALGL
jgi:hypothetical protein